MCIPVAIAAAAISAAASIGGAVYSSQQQQGAQKDAANANRQAQEREASRRRQVQLDEQARQTQFDQRADAVNAETLAQNERGAIEQQQAEALSVREAGVDAATGQVVPLTGGPTENPLLMPSMAATGGTVQDAARTVSERLSGARRGMLANAYLSSLGDQQGGTRRGLQTSGADLDMIAGGRRGSLGAYGVDLNRETGAYRYAGTPSMLGDGLMALGSLGAGYAGRLQGKADASAVNLNEGPPT